MWNEWPVCLSCIRPFNWGSLASCGSDLPVAAGNYSHSVSVSAWWMTPAPIEQLLPRALLFFFLTFAWEQTACIPEPKLTQIIISSAWCMIFSLWKTSHQSDLECLAQTAVAVVVLPVKLLVGSIPETYCIVDTRSPQLNMEWCSTL